MSPKLSICLALIIYVDVTLTILDAGSQYGIFSIPLPLQSGMFGAEGRRSIKFM
jgi:hypothetical protein